MILDDAYKLVNPVIQSKQRTEGDSCAPAVKKEPPVDLK